MSIPSTDRFQFEYPTCVPSGATYQQEEDPTEGSQKVITTVVVPLKYFQAPILLDRITSCFFRYCCCCIYGSGEYNRF